MAVSETVLDFTAWAGVVATGVLQREARDAAIPPIMHRIAPKTKKYLAQKINSAKAKKPWSNRLGLKKYMHNSITPSNNTDDSFPIPLKFL